MSSGKSIIIVIVIGFYKWLPYLFIYLTGY